MVTPQKPTSGPDLNFKHLPAYAQYLLDHRLEDYARASLKVGRDMDIPLLRYFSTMSDAQLISMGMQSNREMFSLFAQNKAETIVENSTRSWIANQLPIVQKEQIVAEDIILVNFTRRKVMRDLLSDYTKDVAKFTQVMEEVDKFTMASDTILFKTFIDLQQKRINEANVALQRRERELLEAQEIGQIGSFEWDLAGKSSVYTPQVFKIFEIEQANSMESFMNDVHPEDREKLSTAIAKALKEGTLDCEYRYVRNQKEKVLWSRGKTAFEGAKPVKVIGTIMDVTERSKIIARLQQSEELHKQAQVLTHIGNWSWEIDQNKVNWSDEMYRIYGLPPQSEVITLERFLSFVHPDDKEKRMQEIQESMMALVVKEYHFRIVAEGGEVKVLRGRGEIRTDKNKKPLTLVGTCQDITKEFFLNKELKEREVYLDQLLKNAPDAIIVINDQSEIILWNPKTESIFGWNAPDVIGKRLPDVIIPRQHRESHIIGMKRLLNTGESHILNKTIEIEALHKDGREFFIALTISQSVQAGQPIFISFIRDITQERITQQELKAKTQQLASLNQSLEQTNFELVRTNKELESFNFIASHDLQEPLRKIRIFGDRIIEAGGESLSGKALEYAEKMRLAAGRMQKLIDDFLSFSRTMAGQRTFESIDMSVLLEEIKSDLAETIEEKKAIVEADKLPVITGISFQVRQLLVNLISNAIKYGTEGVSPRVVITSSTVLGKDMNFESAIDGEKYVKVAVADNGIGFEQKYADKIFELFQRLHSKETYSGTGIGLSICKKIMENHKGFIEAKGSPDEGAVFTVYFPLKHAAT